MIAELESIASPEKGTLYADLSWRHTDPNVVRIPAQSNAAGDFQLVIPHVNGLISGLHLNYDATDPPAGNVDITFTEVNSGRTVAVTNQADNALVVPTSDNFLCNGPVRIFIDAMGINKKILASLWVRPA